MSFQGTTRSDPYGRSLAHTVLISDGLRRSAHWGKGGAHAGSGANGLPGGLFGPRWAGAAGPGDEVPIARVALPDIAIDSAGLCCPVPHGS
jgi:hypothetical protein